MVNVNGINFNFDNSLLEIDYNIQEESYKQYTWSELRTILARIPNNYTILYDTGSIWDTKNKVRYVFDTFSETPIFQYNFSKNEDVDEHIFSVLDQYDAGPISGFEFVNSLNKYVSGVGHNYLIVEYFHLVLIRMK